ncbi:hypothetical protein NF673_17025 [Pseudomonas moraviensis]|uniref:hypothetical protein n=1 Tax=Pseudomonas moraviensis TaxID=321662 RepID=UPI002093DE66|nr:hypothetical protein [Pseudomonas moraviensis]UST62338.1 hypothetical protein NF673_17025 [Pseudomonas moraviensis]
MSTDSSFDDHKPDSVPTTPEPDVDPVLDPGSPMRDPLARPNVLTPDVSPEPNSGDGIPDDDKMPLPND